MANTGTEASHHIESLKPSILLLCPTCHPAPSTLNSNPKLSGKHSSGVWQKPLSPASGILKSTWRGESVSAREREGGRMEVQEGR
jgi:hypothetical protein